MAANRIRRDILQQLATSTSPLTVRDLQDRLTGSHPAGGSPSRTTITRQLGDLITDQLVCLAGNGARGAVLFTATDLGRVQAAGVAATRKGLR